MDPPESSGLPARRRNFDRRNLPTIAKARAHLRILQIDRTNIVKNFRKNLVPINPPLRNARKFAPKSRNILIRQSLQISVENLVARGAVGITQIPVSNVATRVRSLKIIVLPSGTNRSRERRTKGREIIIGTPKLPRGVAVHRPKRDPWLAKKLHLRRTATRREKKSTPLQRRGINQRIEGAIWFKKKLVDRTKEAIGIQGDFAHRPNWLPPSLAPAPSHPRHRLINTLLLRRRQHGVREKYRAKRHRIRMPRKTLKLTVRGLILAVIQIQLANTPWRVPWSRLRSRVEIDLTGFIVGPKCHPPHDRVRRTRLLIRGCAHPGGQLLRRIIIRRGGPSAVSENINPLHGHRESGGVVGAIIRHHHPGHIPSSNLFCITKSLHRGV